MSNGGSWPHCATLVVTAARPTSCWKTVQKSLQFTILKHLISSRNPEQSKPTGRLLAPPWRLLITIDPRTQLPVATMRVIVGAQTFGWPNFPHFTGDYWRESSRTDVPHNHFCGYPGHHLWWVGISAERTLHDNDSCASAQSVPFVLLNDSL